MVKISGSILTKSDSETLLKLNNTDMDYLHVDVMDGVFVSEVHFPVSEIKNVCKFIDKKLDVHLMVSQPDVYLDDLASLNIEYVTVHYEALKGNSGILKKIKNKGIKCGISVKPITDIKDIFYLLDGIDLVLIMSVEPGRGQQTFLESSLSKVRELKSEIVKRGLATIISIDGGINNLNAKSCAQAGCDMLVSGSYITNSINYQASIDSLRR